MSEQEKENDVSDVIEEFEGQDIPFAPSYMLKMNEFMSKSSIDEFEPTFYLYQYDNYHSGKQKSLIDKFYQTAPPDEHDIGIEYGSGRFILILVMPISVKHPDGLMRAYRFRVNQIYDKRSVRKGSGSEQPVPPSMPQQFSPPVPVQNNQAPMLEAFTMIEKIISVIAPLLNRPQQQQNPDGVQDVIKDTYAVVSEVMKNSMVENFKMIQDMQRNQIEFMDDKEDKRRTDPPEPSFLEKIAPLLQEWLPKLLKDDAQSKVVQGLIKNVPQVKEILSDQSQLTAVVNYLVETEGVESTAKVLQNLGIPFEIDQSSQHEVVQTAVSTKIPKKRIKKQA